MIKMNYIFWLILSSLFFVGGEFWSKKFALDPKISFVILVLITYGVADLLWLPAILQKNQLSIVGVMWSVMSLTLTLLMGVLIFKEHLSLTGILGIITAFVSIILLSIS